MRVRRTRAGAVAVVAALAAITVGAVDADAAPQSTGYQFVGWAGGSLVRALNGIVTSDLTAASSINSEDLVSQTNDLVDVTVPNLLDTGDVATSAASTAIPGGYQVQSRARTAGVSALGGLIIADGIDTVSTVKIVNGVASATTQTTFVGLKVGNVTVPLNVRPNTIIRIPNIATVAVNYRQVSASGNNASAVGIGVYVSLLKPIGKNAIGAELSISPTTAQIGPATIPPSGHYLYGHAYGTKVNVKVGNLAGIKSGETAPITMPGAGTNGQVETSAILGVHLTMLAEVGAITNSVQGTNTAVAYDGTAASRIGAINLFNGLIRADAVGSFARVRGPALPLNVVPTVTGGATLVNLIINGKPINLSANPNTVINIAGIAKITINQQIRPNNRSMIVRALYVQLLSAQSGFPAGAEIELAVSWVAVS